MTSLPVRQSGIERGANDIVEDDRKIEEVDFCKGKLLARCKRVAEGGKAGRRERRMCFYVACVAAKMQQITYYFYGISVPHISEVRGPVTFPSFCCVAVG